MKVNNLKKCAECRVNRALSAFHRDRSRSDGLCVICKGCMRNRHLKRYVPKLVRGKGPCDCCGATSKVMKDRSVTRAGIVREHGQLCSRCRMLARVVSRDTELLDKLADYLDSHNRR